MNQVPSLASGIPVYCAHHAIVQIDELKPHPSNPRRHPEKQLAVYSQVIKSNGWRQSVIISKRSGFVVSGHGAVEAARKIGATECPVSYQDYATEADELADLLAQNRLHEMGETDETSLKSILEKIAPLNIITGYEGELDRLLKSIAPKPSVRELVPPTPPKLGWALIALPIGRFAEIQPHLDAISKMEGVHLETTVSNS